MMVRIVKISFDETQNLEEEIIFDSNAAAEGSTVISTSVDYPADISGGSACHSPGLR